MSAIDRVKDFGNKDVRDKAILELDARVKDIEEWVGGMKGLGYNQKMREDEGK